jgi:hypothetical protein
MGTFNNTSLQYVGYVESISKGFKQRLDNTYYKFSDKKPTITTYYNTNTTMSTLDSALRQSYSHTGEFNSPIVYNKIDHMIILGLEKIVTAYDNGDWGLETQDVDGEGVILPNTIIPYPNDYFVINIIDQPLLFKVTSVTPDTLYDGANFYKITYKLDKDTNLVENQVIDNYIMLVDNVGTQFNSVIKTEDYKAINKCLKATKRLRGVYRELFYNESVQTFIINFDGDNFYDPYLIEFFIRTGVMSGSDDDYMYIMHQNTKPKNFKIEYEKTMFHLTEKPETMDKKSPHRFRFQAKLIENKLSIFYTRLEKYYEVFYYSEPIRGVPVIEAWTLDELSYIYTEEYYEDEDSWKNIIIKFLNGRDISVDEILALERIEVEDCMSIYYNIPLVLYIADTLIKRLIEKKIT